MRRATVPSAFSFTCRSPRLWRYRSMAIISLVFAPSAVTEQNCETSGGMEVIV
jgi:hypothetical protein